jgi:hypothetical protein
MADACLRQPLPRQEGRESVSAILDHTVQFLGRFRFVVNRNGIKNLCKCKMSRMTLEQSCGDTTLRMPGHAECNSRAELPEDGLDVRGECHCKGGDRITQVTGNKLLGGSAVGFSLNGA